MPKAPRPLTAEEKAERDEHRKRQNAAQNRANFLQSALARAGIRTSWDGDEPVNLTISLDQAEKLAQRLTD